jgi:hypothetical protein
MSVPISTLMIKTLFIAVALAASGGMGVVYAQAASPQPTPSGDAAAPAGSATRNSSPEPKKANTVEVKREELGQKLLKRKMELDNEKPNIQPAQIPDRARERQETPAEHKGQKK